MRYKILKVSLPVLAGLFKRGKHSGYFIKDDGLPKDARIINVRMSFDNAVDLLLESKDFEEVLDEKAIPVMKPIFIHQLKTDDVDYHGNKP